MAKPDDSTLPTEDVRFIRLEAARLLRESGATGIFPTPVEAILEHAKVVVAPEDALSDGFLSKLRRTAGQSLKRALAKVLGVLDTVARIIYIDRGIYVVKQTFLKLHETAHAWLPAQLHAYRMVEDSEKELSSDVSDLFDRQANAFASEVLFQLDAFTEEAADYDFGFKAPLTLSKKYGASLYSAIRRYVSHNHRDCAVIVLNKPEFRDGVGRVCTLRRFVPSPRFVERFGCLNLPEEFSDSDAIGRAIPLVGRKMSGPRRVVIKDRNGVRHECVVEGFTQTHQVFLLVCPVASLTAVSIVVPGLPAGCQSVRGLQDA